MKKHHVQGALCLVAVIHIFLYGPTKAVGTLPISDGIHGIYTIAWVLSIT